MTRPRQQLISTSDTPYYHCICRCVRRAYLCGEDNVTGRNYDHRKQWLVDRIKWLASIFSIDICAYAVMSNHYHIVLRVDEDASTQWTDDEVIRRWTQLFKGPLIVQRYQENALLSQAQRQTLDDMIAIWRNRLADISWFMRCLNENIAREANREDDVTGRFWEGRFKSYALKTEVALLSCMAYVDLNPVRAGISDSLDDSDFTSIQERLQVAAKKQKSHKAKPEDVAQPRTLLKFLGAENQKTNEKGISFSPLDYFTLVDWTGRAMREGKRGAIPDTVAPILDKMNIEPEAWIERAIHNKTNRKTRATKIPWVA